MGVYKKPTLSGKRARKLSVNKTTQSPFQGKKKLVKKPKR